MSPDLMDISFSAQVSILILVLALIVTLTSGLLALTFLTATAVLTFVVTKVLLTKFQSLPSLLPESLMTQHTTPDSDDKMHGKFLVRSAYSCDHNMICRVFPFVPGVR